MRGLTWIGALSVMAPIAVEIPAAFDTVGTHGSETRLRVAGGAGSYAFIARGCEGQVIDHVPVDFRDASLAMEHRFPGQGFVVGVRGGVIEDRIGASGSRVFPEVPEGRTVTTRYVNPHIAMEALDTGIGIGWVAHDGEFITTGESARTHGSHPVNDVSGHLRIGRLDRRYWLVQWMESEPLYSGGGYFTVTLGGRLPNSGLELRGGLAAGGPYEGSGLTLRGNYPIGDGLRISLSGRGGFSGNEPAAGVGLGLEYRMRPRTGVRP